MSEPLIALAEIIAVLNAAWTPHPKQIEIGCALFYEGVKDIFVCAARNFGKTELSCYCLWRYAMEHPGSENYIIFPLAVQGREILWVSQRLQKFGPDAWIESINNTEMRITFKNGSFIKVTGSDNAAALAGIKPKGLIIYDEAADHREASIKNMEPNRAAHDSPALFVGAPPEFDCYYVELMETAKIAPGWAYFHAKTEDNPHISRDWLERKKAAMILSGDEEGWLRSYEGIYIKGGKRHIFPQFLKYKPKPLSDLLPKDLNKWQLVVHFDPATTSTFGVLISLHNPYTKKLILVDEVYESEMAKMTTRQIWQAVDPLIDKWVGLGCRKDWVTRGYDEAAAWFMNETTEVKKGVWLSPTKKNQYGVETGIGMVRDIFRTGQIEVADHLLKFIWEMENYLKDENGKIPKENDHQINNLQYTLQLLGYRFDEEDPPKVPPIQDQRRAYSLEQDMADEYSLDEIG